MIGGGRFFSVFILIFVIYYTDIVLAMAFAQETVGLSRQFCLATCNARCCVISRAHFGEWRVCYEGLEADEVWVESLHSA